MLGEVKVWYMTEEERQAYIKKHPIIPMEKTKGAAFDNFQHDYKWRSDKGAKASKKARNK